MAARRRAPSAHRLVRPDEGSSYQATAVLAPAPRAGVRGRARVGLAGRTAARPKDELVRPRSPCVRRGPLAQPAAATRHHLGRRTSTGPIGRDGHGRFLGIGRQLRRRGGRAARGECGGTRGGGCGAGHGAAIRPDGRACAQAAYALAPVTRRSAASHQSRGLPGTPEARGSAARADGADAAKRGSGGPAAVGLAVAGPETATAGADSTTAAATAGAAPTGFACRARPREPAAAGPGADARAAAGPRAEARVAAAGRHRLRRRALRASADRAPSPGLDAPPATGSHALRRGVELKSGWQRGRRPCRSRCPRWANRSPRGRSSAG
jgi:hypothetical protein